VICLASSFSACIGLMLWWRLRAHDTQVLEKLAQNYSINADDVLNSSSIRKVILNLDTIPSSLYVIQESFSEETASSLSIIQFSEDEDHSSHSQERSREIQQQQSNGTPLTNQTRILNDDGNIQSDHSYNGNLLESSELMPIKSPRPTEEELDLEFLMHLTPNPEYEKSHGSVPEIFGEHILSPRPTAKVSMICLEGGFQKTGGSLVLSSRVAKEFKLPGIPAQAINSVLPAKKESSFQSISRQSDVVESESFARPLKSFAPKFLQSPRTSDRNTIQKAADLKQSTPRSLSSGVTADEAQITGIDYSLPAKKESSFQSISMAQASVVHIPRSVTASSISNPSPAPTRFSYKKPDIVKDLKRRR
jgi:hypothetical protein